MYILHAMQLESLNVKTIVKRMEEILENLGKYLEFKEMTSVLANYEILLRQQHFLCFYAQHFSAAHVLVVDED
jgi:hypothetical protein